MCSMHNHDFRRRRGWWFAFGLPIFLAFLAVGSLAFMLLWNALLPVIFGLKAIGYWQAVGLLLLAKILFGGWGRRPSTFLSRRRHWEEWKKWHDEHHESSPGDRPHGSEGAEA